MFATTPDSPVPSNNEDQKIIIYMNNRKLVRPTLSRNLMGDSHDYM